MFLLSLQPMIMCLFISKMNFLLRLNMLEIYPCYFPCSFILCFYKWNVHRYSICVHLFGWLHSMHKKLNNFSFCVHFSLEEIYISFLKEFSRARRYHHSKKFPYMVDLQKIFPYDFHTLYSWNRCSHATCISMHSTVRTGISMLLQGISMHCTVGRLFCTLQLKKIFPCHLTKLYFPYDSMQDAKTSDVNLLYTWQLL